MELHNQKSDIIRERIINSDNLQTRAMGNTLFSGNNFDAWVDEILSSLPCTSVLDICCGTGNQLVKFAKNKNIKKLVGVDLSQASLDTAQHRVEELATQLDFAVKNISIDVLFSDPELDTNQFDLVSCFYGLYYATDTKKLLHEVIDHLDSQGYIVIVGPYGKNNFSLFNVLERFFPIPDFVKRASCTFMPNEVLPVLAQRMRVQEKSLINVVKYPNVQAVLDYWKASTFYSAQHEELVKRALEEHFMTQSEFIVEKHIKAYIAQKI